MRTDKEIIRTSRSYDESNREILLDIRYLLYSQLGDVEEKPLRKWLWWVIVFVLVVVSILINDLFDRYRRVLRRQALKDESFDPGPAREIDIDTRVEYGRNSGCINDDSEESPYERKVRLGL